MKTLKALCSNLLRNRKAATATIMAITLPVVIGGTALAIDVANFRLVHNRMQAAVDAAALAAVVQIEARGPIKQTAVDLVDANLPDEWGNVTTDADVTVGTFSKGGGFVPGEGASANAVRVRAERSMDRGNAVGRLFSSIWNGERMTVSTTAIAARPANVFYEPPEGLVLDSNAGDFNEMYAYCFRYEGASSNPDENTDRRSQMTLIANNMPSNQNIVTISGGRVSVNPPTPMQWPDCSAKGLSLSFRLRNIRHAKNNSQLWANPNATISGIQPGRPEHNWYTDTKIDDGVETFNTGTRGILETKLCDTAAECKSKRQGGTIDAGVTNRGGRQSMETRPCQPGKFMYFGFEDRPGIGGRSVTPLGKGWLEPGWTDFDFDDIAIQMKCPSSGKLADPNPRLVG
jgi:Flp pilus assembly protein TadG